ARHVVEHGAVTEGDRSWVATVFAANADFQFWTGLAASIDANFDQFAYALLIDRDKRIGSKDTARSINSEEARRIIARNSEGGLREAVRAERKEFSGSLNVPRSQRCMSPFDHRADLVPHLYAPFP